MNAGVEGPGRGVPREAKAMAAADPGQAAAVVEAQALAARSLNAR